MKLEITTDDAFETLADLREIFPEQSVEMVAFARGMITYEVKGIHPCDTVSYGIESVWSLVDKYCYDPWRVRVL